MRIIDGFAFSQRRYRTRRLVFRTISILIEARWRFIDRDVAAAPSHIASSTRYSQVEPKRNPIAGQRIMVWIANGGRVPRTLAKVTCLARVCRTLAFQRAGHDEFHSSIMPLLPPICFTHFFFYISSPSFRSCVVHLVANSIVTKNDNESVITQA